MARMHTVTYKVKTEFGSMYIHINLNSDGRPVGGHISSHGKETTSQIHRLVETLSLGLQEALKIGTPD